jgi:hypothetical protein
MAPRSSSSWNHRQKAPIKEFGTQTDSFGAQLVGFLVIFNIGTGGNFDLSLVTVFLLKR